jgi:hypothetical protein
MKINQILKEDAEPMDREFALVKKLGRLGERIVQNPKLWDRYDQAVDNDDTDWVIGLIQDGTGATVSEVTKLADLFGEIGGGLGRIVDFAWAVKEGTWDKDFMNPYRAHRSQDLNEFSFDKDGGDDGGDDPYKYPQPEHYNRSIDFFGQFEADHFDDEEFNKATGVFKGYWDDAEGRDQIAYFKFDNSRRTGDDDPGMGWYYEPQMEGIKGEIAGGALGTLVGGAAGSVLGPVGGAVGSALGGSAGAAIGGRWEDGKPLKEKQQQLDEMIPLLAAGARLFMAMAPKIAQVVGKAGQAGARGAVRGAGQATRAGAEIAAKNAGQIGMGAAAYEIGSSVADIVKDITAKVGTAVDEKTVLELAQLAFKYAIPAGIVLAIMYGGKKAIDAIFDKAEDRKAMAENNDDDYGPELDALKKEFGKFTTHYDRMDTDPAYAASYNRQQTDRQNRDMPNDAEDDYDAEDDFMSDRTHNMGEGWKEESQDLEDWAKEVNKKLYKAHASQRPALAQQLSQLEHKHFGSPANPLTRIVKSALTALQNGQMPHYDSDKVGAMPFGSLVGDDAKEIAAANLHASENQGYSILKRNRIVDTVDDFLRLVDVVRSLPPEYLFKYKDAGGQAWFEIVKDIGWSKNDAPGQRYRVSQGMAEAPGAETFAHNQSTVASNEKAFDLEEGKPKEKEADYGADYQDMVARVKKLAGMGPLKTVYDPQKRVYKNVPVAVQPKKEQR